ncbi:hypothetical protein K5549_003358 [Capra hircus]|nr:hypothetical protein K5549_003358 [Capra hircus]
MPKDRYLSDAQVIKHTLQSVKSFPCLISSSLGTKLQSKHNQFLGQCSEKYSKFQNHKYFRKKNLFKLI